jgi:S-DNA-T family DNA segregation ATPase FtsK/SpoIIIE
MSTAHQTQPRQVDPEITAYNLNQALWQRKIGGAVVTLLFDGPQIETYRISHFHARVKPEEIESLAGAFAMAAGVKSARVSRGQGCLYAEIPKPENTRRALHPATLERGRPPSTWHVPLGVGVDGRVVWLNIAAVESPHLLVSGTTGSGKSLAIAWLLYRLLRQNPPERLRLILGGPKQFQLDPWAHCAHLLHPPERRPDELVKLLLWAQGEVERRMTTGERPGDNGGPPRLLVVVDEVAHLAQAARRIMAAIEGITATGREAGVHLLISTQYPKVEVIPSLGLANFSARLAGRTTGVLQNVVATGKAHTMADVLLGRGDFLFITGNQAEPVRVQMPLFWPTLADLKKLPLVPQVKPLELAGPEPERETRGGWNRKGLDWEAVGAYLAGDKPTVSGLAEAFGINHRRAQKVWEAFWSQEAAWPPVEE